MDAEKLLEAFTDQETQEVAAALPDNVFAAEAVRRGFTDPIAAGFGTLAVERAMATEAATEADLFQTDIREFLSPDTPLNAFEQLNVMDTFWQKLGIVVPALNQEQLERLQAKLEAQPNRRVVPVPLLDLDGRQTIAERAKTALPACKFSSDYGALWTPDTNSIYGKLLGDLEDTVKDGRKRYGLRYHTEDSVVSRSELVVALEESGRAVEDEDITVWLFTVMDVRVESPREYARADQLHAAADITQVPEALLTMQLLHQANGTPNSIGDVDLTNEALYELDKKGNPVALLAVTGVGWNPLCLQLDLKNCSANNQSGYSGVRAAQSGL